MIKRIIGAISFVYFLIVWAVVLFAAPVITGVTQTSTTITINGTGFGTRGDYGGSETFLMKKWGNWEVETGVTHGGDFGIAGPSNEWSIQTSGGKTNSTRFIRRQYVATRLAALNYYKGSDTTGTYYDSFWFNHRVATQGKNHRNYLGPSSSNDNHFLATGGGDGNTQRGQSESNLVPSRQYNGNGTNIGAGTGWHRIEFLDIRTGSGTGTVWCWVDGILQWTDPDWWVNLDYSPSGHDTQLCNLIEYASVYPGGQWDFDDWYSDYSQARVELCNSSTTSYSSRGKSEPQLVTSWSNTQIVCDKNLGIFSNGNSAKIIVIDSSGSTSNVFTISLSSSGGGDTVNPTLQSVSPAANTENISAD